MVVVEDGADVAEYPCAPSLVTLATLDGDAANFFVGSVMACASVVAEAMACVVRA